MSTALSPPPLTAFAPLHKPAATTSRESHAAVARLAPILCGGGLILYGMLRGSWLGLTLAAAGGYLVYRGLTSPPRAANGCRLPLHDDSQTAGMREWSPTVVLPPIDAEAQMNRNIAECATPITASAPASLLDATRREELTADEHGEAEVAAYYRALQRGGGWLPPYDYFRAVEDFCWAAEMVVRQRVGG